jgi:peptide/nickel transport system substrate-binding protein
MCANLRNPDLPVASKEVRQAIAWAVDRQSIVDNIYYGYAVPDDDPFLPGLPGDDPDPSHYPNTPDLEKARELMAQAGFPDGFTVACITSGKPHLRQEMELVAGQLSEIGITLDLQPLDSATFRQVQTESHDYEMLLEDISLSGPDGDPCVYWFLHSSVKTQYAGYKNDDVNKWLDEARASGDFGVRNELYHKVMDQVYEDCPMIYMAHVTQPYVMNSKLEGFRPGRTEYMVYWDRIRWSA